MRKVFIVLFILLTAALSQAQTQKTSANSDALESIYNLRLTDLNDKVIDFKSLKGNAFMISFGATWCPQCRAGLAPMEAITKEYKDKPVKFFWVSIDESNVSNRDLSLFAKSFKFTFPILRDPKSEAYLNYSNRYKLPTILFVDANGKVIAPIQFGMFQTSEEYKNYMRKRLNAILQTHTTQAKE